MTTLTDKILNAVKNLITENKLPHAILLVGKNQNFIEQYINLYGNLLLNTDKIFSHLDFLHIEPYGKSWEIKIEQIREAIIFSQKSPKIAQNKIIFIENADRLNKNSANSILKTLEEPTPNTFFILATDSLDNILPTIKSRCATIFLSAQNNNEQKNSIPSPLFPI